MKLHHMESDLYAYVLNILRELRDKISKDKSNLQARMLHNDEQKNQFFQLSADISVLTEIIEALTRDTLP